MKFIQFQEFIIPIDNIEYLWLDPEPGEFLYFQIELRTRNGESLTEQFNFSEYESQGKCAIAAAERFAHLFMLVNRD